MNTTPNELVVRFRAGDKQAGDELFHRYAGELMNLLRRRLRNAENRNSIDSQELLHDGFKSFFSLIQKPVFDPVRASIGGLLNRIVSRKALALLRRKRPVSMSPDDIEARLHLTSAMLDADLSEPETEAAFHELVSIIFNELTDKERKALEMYLDPWQDRSVEELAKTCRLSIKTVRVTIDLFILRLRRLTAEDEQCQTEG